MAGLDSDRERRTEPDTSSERPLARADAWATPRDRLEVGEGAVGDAAAVHGRRLSGPIQGFGRLWQKTYTVPLEGVAVAPAEVITAWRQRFGEFWPDDVTFHAPLAGLEPGEVALFDGRAGAVTLSSGVLVLYADDESFSFLTPEGHWFSGMITFSASRDDDLTAARVQVLIRANDPLMELMMPLRIHRQEDRFWRATLTALARHHGVEDPQVQADVVCVDRRRQWRRFGNIRDDAAFRSLLRPFRSSR
jgi:hypothetical protein